MQRAGDNRASRRRPPGRSAAVLVAIELVATLQALPRPGRAVRREKDRPMIIVTTPPAGEPVTLAEVKALARVDHSEDDALLESRIKVARESVERRCGIAMLTQTLKLVTDGFGSAGLQLPRPPLQSVTSIVYKDPRHEAVTLAPSEYLVRGAGGSAFVLPATSWPTTDGLFGAVEVTYVAGYGDAPDDVPEPLREAVKQIVAHLYDNPTGASVDAMHALPYGFDDLVADYRQWGFG